MKIVTGPHQVVFRDRFETIRELLELSAKRFSENIPAYIFHEEDSKLTVKKSYAELLEDIETYALGLLALTPVNPLQAERDHVGIMANNSYPWVIHHTSMMFGLGVSVPLDKQLPDHEAASLLKRGNVSCFAFDYGQIDKLALMAQENPQIHTYILLDQLGKIEEVRKILEENAENPDFKLLSFKDIVRAGQGADDHDLAELRKLDPRVEKMNVLSFTSGTTAQSKGVMLSHKNIVSDIWFAVNSLHYPEGLRALSVLPLHHAFESTVGMYCLWLIGVTICINENLRTLLPNLKEWKINMIICVPLMLTTIYRNIQKNIDKTGKRKKFEFGLKLSKFLRKFGIDMRRKLFKDVHDAFGGELIHTVVGAAALPVDIQEFFEDIGIYCVSGYGLTETSPIISAASYKDNAYGSVGKPLYSLQVAIDGQGTSEETAGEILVKGDTVMLGYYENEAATLDSFNEDGWFKTGDLGYFDHEDNLYISGRAKSLIVLSNGKNVFPEEIEGLYLETSGIKQAMVWGEKNARGAVDICCRFQIDREAIAEAVPSLKEEDITNYLRSIVKANNSLVPIYKHVSYFIWDESDPIMTTTLKIKRDQELARIMAKLEDQDRSMRELKESYLDLS